MKLQDIRFSGERLIEAYGDNGFRFTDGRREGSVLILPRRGVENFPCERFEQFEESMFDPVIVAASDIEILLFGTGQRQCFPPAALRRRFADMQIALEAMDTGAACRTYNVLVSESRRVAAALIAI